MIYMYLYNLHLLTAQALHVDHMFAPVEAKSLSTLFCLLLGLFLPPGDLLPPVYRHLSLQPKTNNKWHIYSQWRQAKKFRQKSNQLFHMSQVNTKELLSLWKIGEELGSLHQHVAVQA